MMTLATLIKMHLNFVHQFKSGAYSIDYNVEIRSSSSDCLWLEF